MNNNTHSRDIPHQNYPISTLNKREAAWVLLDRFGLPNQPTDVDRLMFDMIHQAQLARARSKTRRDLNLYQKSGLDE